MTDSILVVDDDPGAIQLMGRILSSVGTLRFATTGADAVRLVRESVPDLVLLDAEMPGMSGFAVFDALRAVPDLAEVPVIFVTNHSETAFEVTALEMGAADFIAKPVSPPLVLARVKTHLRMKRLSDELRVSAATDSLTGIANRRQFDEWLQQEWLRSRRHGYPISLLLIDIDHFKLYNDRYGHPKGDVCLRQVARAIDQSARRTADLVARCGGEEFGVLLPHTGRLGADYSANRILKEVEGLAIAHSASPTGSHLSVTIGIGCYDDASAGWVPGGGDPGFGRGSAVQLSHADLLLAADKALYSAKRAGRAQLKLMDINEAAVSEAKLSSSQELRALRGAA